MHDGAGTEMRNSTSLSQKAGNAIEVITSLITTLHAIWDREFVSHKRYLHLALCHLAHVSALSAYVHVDSHVDVRACTRELNILRTAYYVSIQYKYTVAPLCDSAACMRDAFTDLASVAALCVLWVY